MELLLIVGLIVVGVANHPRRDQAKSAGRQEGAGERECQGRHRGTSTETERPSRSLPPITLDDPACPSCGAVQDHPPQRRRKGGGAEMAGRPSTHVPHKSLTQRSSPDLHPSHPPAYLPPTVTQGTPETAIPLDAVAPVRVVWRFDAQPACAVHVAALPARRPPLKLPGSRLRRPVRAPGPPPRPSAQFPAGQGRARTHMPARAAWKFSERKIRERETARRARSVPWGSGREGDIGSCASASDFPEAGRVAPRRRAKCTSRPLRDWFHTSVVVTRGLQGSTSTSYGCGSPYVPTVRFQAE